MFFRTSPVIIIISIIISITVNVILVLTVITLPLALKDGPPLGTSATSPAQLLGPSAFFSDSDLNRVKPPEPVFSEEEEASLRAGQCPVRPAGHPSPVRQPAGVIMLPGHGSEVQHVVAGALEDDHVTQGSVVEGGVGMAREAQIAHLPGETRVQDATGIAPHLLPCSRGGSQPFPTADSELGL